MNCVTVSDVLRVFSQLDPNTKVVVDGLNWFEEVKAICVGRLRKPLGIYSGDLEDSEDVVFILPNMNNLDGTVSNPRVYYEAA